MIGLGSDNRTCEKPRCCCLTTIRVARLEATYPVSCFQTRHAAWTPISRHYPHCLIQRASPPQHPPQNITYKVFKPTLHHPQNIKVSDGLQCRLSGAVCAIFTRRPPLRQMCQISHISVNLHRLFDSGFHTSLCLSYWNSILPIAAPSIINQIRNVYDDQLESRC